MVLRAFGSCCSKQQPQNPETLIRAQVPALEEIRSSYSACGLLVAVAQHRSWDASTSLEKGLLSDQCPRATPLRTTFLWSHADRPGNGIARSTTVPEMQFVEATLSMIELLLNRLSRILSSSLENNLLQQRSGAAWGTGRSETPAAAAVENKPR
ncbi:unnamed protein product [Cercospora beticola]|nr:unnamed protein product [Cercospora beticola]